jgi:hypothetical protein
MKAADVVARFSLFFFASRSISLASIVLPCLKAEGGSPAEVERDVLHGGSVNETSLHE